jgi:hypothetical protein
MEIVMRKFFIYFIILLIAVYPASAGEVSLNRWILNLNLNDDGLVEDVIQVEIENAGTSPLDGFSFVVPASTVTIDNMHITSIPATGQAVKQQTVQGGVKIIIDFNKPVDPETKWNGRIEFTAEKWAVKEGSDYSINIPVTAPQAVVSGKDVDISVPADAEIRSQVFLPKAVDAASIEVKSKESAPYKKLLQWDHIVLTWFQLHIGDVISIKGSYSETLKQIVDADEKLRELSARIIEAKAKGIDVGEAEAHLKNAEDYNTNQALASFWKKDSAGALECVGYANDELKLAESILLTAGKAQHLPEETAGSKETPAVGVTGLIPILLISFLRHRSYIVMFK